jgi:hypothetical protein
MSDFRTNFSRNSSLGVAVLTCVLLAPGIGQVHKYGGWAGVALYLVLGPALIALAPFVLRAALLRLSTRQAIWVAAASIALLALVFALVFPVARSGRFGPGSDEIDAITVGCAALVHGTYPYHGRTQLGNPLAPLPGTLLLALPFYLLGNAAAQNVFWMAVFLLLSYWLVRDLRSALLLFWIVVLACPAVSQQFVTGGDRFSNTVYLLTFMLAAAWAAESQATPVRQALCLVLLGVSFSTRSNFVLLIPLWARFLAERVGWRASLWRVAAVLAVASAFTLPFYLHDPQGFTAFANQYQKVARFSDNILPHSGLIIVGASTLVALALPLRSGAVSRVGFLRDCAIVQAIPVVMTSVLAVVASGSRGLLNADYGVNFLLFGALSVWIVIHGSVARQITPAQARATAAPEA